MAFISGAYVLLLNTSIDSGGGGLVLLGERRAIFFLGGWVHQFWAVGGGGPTLAPLHTSL